MNFNSKKIIRHKPILYRPDIDGLRAIAVNLVVIYHLWPKIISGGFIGVDIFFVISGFLITSIIDKEITSKQFSFQVFYARRIKRILPVFYLVLFFTVLLATCMLLPDDYIGFANSALNASLYYSNMYFLNNNNYFSLGSNELPLLHTWSLAVEEQYYLFWPLVLFLLAKKKPNNIKFKWIVTIGLFITSYVFSIYSSMHNTSLGYYSIFSRAFELMVGAILALIIKNERTILSNCKHKLIKSSIIGITGLILILYTAITINLKTSFPGWIAIIPTSGTALVIYAGHMANKSIITRILSTKILIGIGILSYSIYLWHWPLIAFWHYYNPGLQLSLNMGLKIFVLTYLLAIISYFTLELPLKKKQFTFKSAVLKFQIIPLIIMATLSIVITQTGGLPNRINSKLKLETTFIDAKYCHGRSVGKCILGDLSDNNQPKAILFGDSHAGQFSPFWEEIAKHYHFKIKFISTGGCYPLLDTFNTQPSDSTNTLGLPNPGSPAFGTMACSAQIKNVSTNFDKYKLFIIIARWDGYYNNKIFSAEFENTLKFLLTHNKKVIIMGDSPVYLNNSIPTILRQSMVPIFANKIPALTPANNLIYSQKINKISKKYRNVYYFDTEKLLILNYHNFPYDNDSFLLLKDNDHLNQYASKKMAKDYLSSPESQQLNSLFKSWVFNNM